MDSPLKQTKYQSSALACVGQLGPKIDMDCLSHLFQFCSIGDRRTLSCASVGANEAYKGVRKEVCSMVLYNMCLERKRRWSMPIFNSKDQTWGDCFPEVIRGRKMQAMEYLGYQCQNLTKSTGMANEEDPGNIVAKDKLVARVFTLYAMMVMVACGDNIYDVLDQVSADYSDGVVDEFIGKGGGTLAEMGTMITAGDGVYLPLYCLFD